MKAAIYARTSVSSKSEPMEKEHPSNLEIKDLKQFVKAALSEFWFSHPKVYQSFCVHLGSRIDGLKHGHIQEDEYIRKWEELPK